MLAVEEMVKDDDEKVRVSTAPNTPLRIKGLTTVETLGSQNVPPADTVVDNTCDVSRGLLEYAQRRGNAG